MLVPSRLPKAQHGCPFARDPDVVVGSCARVCAGVEEEVGAVGVGYGDRGRFGGELVQAIAKVNPQGEGGVGGEGREYQGILELLYRF